jgi:C-terminal processing protease CtpA/Prc
VVKYKLDQGINQFVRDLSDECHLLEPRHVDKGDQLLIVRIPAFALSPAGVDNVIDRMRKHKGAVIDLRSSPGGFILSLDRLVGGIFENTSRFSTESHEPPRKASH